MSDLSRVFRDTFTSNTGANKVSAHIADLLDVTVDDSEGIFERSLLVPAGSTKEEQSNNKIIFKNAQETNKDANILDIIKGLLSRSESFTSLLPGPGDWEGSPLVDDINLFEHPEGPPLTRIDLDTYSKWLLREFLSSKNFYNFLLQSVCPSFLFDYVCPFYDESSPTSRLQYTKVNTQPDGVKVHFLDEVKSVSLNLASSYQRPISQIITHGTVTMPHGAAAGTQTPLGAHPPAPDPKFGKIVNMSAPGWWSSYHRNEQQLAEAPKTSDGIQGNGRQIKANAQNKTNDIKKIHKEPKELSFLQNWATLQYGNLALQHTHAALVLPLDLRWGKDPDFQIGERILIIAGKPAAGIEATKKPYFEGFLQAVSHDIAVESSGTGVSQTHLEFSHIKTYGASDGPVGWSIFSLPGDKPLG